MMTEEEYKKMVQERENYKRSMVDRHNNLERSMRNLHMEYEKNLIRMANPTKTDEELFREGLITPVSIYDFYEKEEKRLNSFWKRLKKKLFG